MSVAAGTGGKLQKKGKRKAETTGTSTEGEDDSAAAAAPISTEGDASTGGKRKVPPPTAEPSAATTPSAAAASSKPSDPSQEISDEAWESGRLFLRNLPFTVTEDDLTHEFERFGDLIDVHVVMDKSARRAIGVGYVQFAQPECAMRAYSQMDGSVFLVCDVLGAYPVDCWSCGVSPSWSDYFRYSMFRVAYFTLFQPRPLQVNLPHRPVMVMEGSRPVKLHS